MAGVGVALVGTMVTATVIDPAAVVLGVLSIIGTRLVLGGLGAV